jgi:hypothetical protein
MKHLSLALKVYEPPPELAKASVDASVAVRTAGVVSTADASTALELAAAITNMTEINAAIAAIDLPAGRRRAFVTSSPPFDFSPIAYGFRRCCYQHLPAMSTYLRLIPITLCRDTGT